MIKRPDYIGVLKLYENLSNEKPLSTRVGIYFSIAPDTNISLAFDSFNHSHFLHYIGKENSMFKNLRLKKIDNGFILSGLWKEGNKIYLSVAKFKGLLPERYTFYEDDLEYPTDYWSLDC